MNDLSPKDQYQRRGIGPHLVCSLFNTKARRLEGAKKTILVLHFSPQPGRRGDKQRSNDGHEEETKNQPRSREGAKPDAKKNFTTRFARDTETQRAEEKI